MVEGAGEGYLIIKDSWPGMLRSIYGDHDRFKQTYFSNYPGYYFTGDGARRDEDGYYWITGRVDDVINVSGHRLGTAEIESALVAHPSVAEAAVVGSPHDLKGQGTLRVRHAKGRLGNNRPAPKGLGAVGAKGDRPDRFARLHPVGPRASKDKVGKDYAAYPQKNCRKRG